MLYLSSLLCGVRSLPVAACGGMSGCLVGPASTNTPRLWHVNAFTCWSLLCSVVTAPLAARQSAHLELFGRPCRCRRCTAEQELPAEVAAELQSVADKAQVGPKGSEGLFCCPSLALTAGGVQEHFHEPSRLNHRRLASGYARHSTVRLHCMH